MLSAWTEQLILAGVRPLCERDSEIPSVKTIANQILKAAQKIPAPKGFGGFGATYLPRLWQVQLLLDVPVQVQDPKRYPNEAPEVETLEKWRDFLFTVDHMLADFRRKHPSIAILKRRQPDDAESEIISRAPISKFK